MDITSSYRSQGEILVIDVGNKFDFSKVEEFRNAYAELKEETTHITVELSRTEYMDSSALGMLLNMPTINYNVKGKDRGFYGRLPFLLNENFIFHAESGDISQILEKIETTNFTSDFEQARKKYFFDRENVCDQILSLV
jgi:hypothetical protein